MLTLSDMSEGSSCTSVLTAGVAVVADAGADDAVVAVVVLSVVLDDVATSTTAGSSGCTAADVDAVDIEPAVVGLASSVNATVAVAARLNFLSFPPLACFHSFKILLSKSTNSALILPVELLVLGTLHTSSLHSASTGVLLRPSNTAEYGLVALVVCSMCSNATNTTRKRLYMVGLFRTSFRRSQ